MDSGNLPILYHLPSTLTSPILLHLFETVYVMFILQEMKPYHDTYGPRSFANQLIDDNQRHPDPGHLWKKYLLLLNDK